MSAGPCRERGGKRGRDGIQYSRKPFGDFLTISALPFESEANVNVHK